MCGRFSLKTTVENLANLFEGLQIPNDYRPRKQIAPTQQVLCIRQDNRNQLEAVWLQWGLIPSWAKDSRIGSKMINARSETVGFKPAFRSAIRKRRCLILADAFYEWVLQGSTKQVYRIYPTDSENPIFCFAGLWERWLPQGNKSASAATVQLDLFSAEGPEGPDEPVERPKETCTILTTAANGKLSQLHNRMPVILTRHQHPVWLERSNGDMATLEPLFSPLDDNLIDFFPTAL